MNCKDCGRKINDTYPNFCVVCKWGESVEKKWENQE